MTQPNTWEYEVEIIPRGITLLEERLKRYGKDDWELCGIVGDKYLIFKRHLFRTDI